MRPLIAFDLDGTLVDSLEDIRRATERAFPQFGEVDAEQAAALVGEGARALVRRHFVANGVTPESESAFEEKLTEGLGAFKRAYRPHLIDNTRPFPGIVALVEELAGMGCAVAVATNKPSVWGREMVDALMPNLFDAVIGPEDAGAHKPSPAMLAFLETRLEASMVSYVGDSVVDIEASAAHKTRCVAVTYGLGKAAALHEAAARSSHAPFVAGVVDDVAGVRRHLVALAEAALLKK